MPPATQKAGWIAKRMRQCAEAPLFMVIDAASDDAILPALAELEEAGAEIACLWDGSAAEDMADVAPYLLAMSPASLTDGLLDRAWGRSWGVVFATELPAPELRRHLRRFLMARAPNGEACFFRFYDPRVLAPFLRHATPEQRERLLPNGMMALCENGRADTVLRFSGAAELPPMPVGAPG